MLTDFFRINLPYGIAQNEKGEWFAFNREYRPLGINDWNFPVSVDDNNNSFGNLPVYTFYKNLNLAFIKKLVSIDNDFNAIQCHENGAIAKVFLYDDGTNPMRKEKGNDILFNNYFAKLKLLSSLQKSELNEKPKALLYTK